MRINHPKGFLDPMLVQTETRALPTLGEQVEDLMRAKRQAAMAKAKPLARQVFVRRDAGGTIALREHELAALLCIVQLDDTLTLQIPQADPPVCPNCGQWQRPDCVNECIKRGLAPRVPEGWQRIEADPGLVAQHDPDELTRLRTFATETRALLVDEQGYWRTDLSGADVIQNLTLTLEQAGLGGEDEDEGCPKGDPDCYGPSDGSHDACESHGTCGHCGDEVCFNEHDRDACRSQLVRENVGRS